MDLFGRKEWYIYAKRADFQSIAEKHGIDPVTARVLRNRDLTEDGEIASFLAPSLRDLHDPELLPGAARAAALILDAVRTQKKIRIAGDYDVDGVCASFVLWDVIRSLGGNCSLVIPDRVKDGYGLNLSLITDATRDGVDLLITCDNGISAFDELAAAKHAGMTVIVTDHHEIRKDENGREILPPADCIVSAKLSDGTYPEKEICGCVTAWKLTQLLLRGIGASEEKGLSYLEFAALATVCDCMPLTGENRAIVSFGLEVLSKGGVNEGIRALIRECGLAGKKIDCVHAGFILGPCINAGGRMENAQRAFSLFVSRDPAEARERATYLKALNDSRKELTVRGTQQASRLVETEKAQKKVLVLYLQDLHESLAGIVAGRLKEKYGRPSFVFTPSGVPGILKGSGRSIEPYPMFEELSACRDLLVKFGGHPMAAGASVRREDLDLLEERLNRQTRLTEEDLTVKVWIDSLLPFAYLSEKLIRELERLEPFGTGNPKPVFAERDLHPANLRVMGKNRNALRLDLYTKEGIMLPAVIFGEADVLCREIGSLRQMDILYYPQLNEWGGRCEITVQIEAFRESTAHTEKQ